MRASEAWVVGPRFCILTAVLLALGLGAPSWAGAPDNLIAEEFEADCADSDDADHQSVPSAQPAPRQASPDTPLQSRTLVAQLSSSAAPRAPPQN